MSADPSSLHTLLPGFLARRFAGRETLQRSLRNSAWLFADQVVRMAAGLVVGVWVARYLGPEQFGWFSYAAALVATVGVVTGLGLAGVVVRELARLPALAPQLLGAAALLRVAGALAGFGVCVGLALLAPADATPRRWLIILTATGLLFQGVDFYDLLFQARGDARFSAYVRMTACVLSSGLKVALILAGASLLAITAATVAELALAAIGWVAFGQRVGLPLGKFSLEGAHVRRLLREGWPLALSGLALYTQAYADQLIIGSLLGGADLGQYAAALRVVGAFGFIPMVLQTVAAPEIARARRDDPQLYRRRLHNFYRVMFGVFVLTALPLALGGPWATRWLFGPAYAQAAALLPWLALRLLFTNMGVARSVFLTNEGLFQFGLLTALAGAIVNLALNFILVPQWGARGAIVSSYASFAVSTFALEALHPRARENLRWTLRAVLLPWRPLDR